MRTDTTYNDDGTVTLWDVYHQQWRRFDYIPHDRILATLNDEERARIQQHIRPLTRGDSRHAED